MEVEKSLIPGLFVMNEEDTDCSFYFNDKMLNDNIMIAVHRHEVDVIEMYHMNEELVYIYLMEIDETISKIATYGIIKNIYTLYNEHETLVFLGTMEQLCLDINYANEETSEELLELQNLATGYFNYARELFHNPGAIFPELNGGKVYQFMANRDKKAD